MKKFIFFFIFLLSFFSTTTLYSANYYENGTGLCPATFVDNENTTWEKGELYAVNSVWAPNYVNKYYIQPYIDLYSCVDYPDAKHAYNYKYYAQPACTDTVPDGYILYPKVNPTTCEDYNDLNSSEKSKYITPFELPVDICGNCYAKKALPCPAGSILNSNNQCCDIGNADTAYNVDQATCESSPAFIKIDDLEGLINISWNTCMNECVAKSTTCPAGKVFDSNGYCVTPFLDDTACKAQGGTLQNYGNTQVDTCIDNGGTSHTPCCTYEADCVVNGSIVDNVSTYVTCGADTNQTNENNNTIDLNVTSGDNNNPDNTCHTCPTQYPIANDQGSCENSNGEILMCPEADNNNTQPVYCGTCMSLDGNWFATTDGRCKKTTANGIVQYVSCPTDTSSNTTDTNITTDTTDTNGSINNLSQDGNGSHESCTHCPDGFISLGGNCGVVTTTGKVTALIACPGGSSTVDANGSGPADSNGTDNNATDLMNGFGNSIQKQINNAYKGYSFFNETDCGTLDVSPSVYLFNQPNAEIRDPLPMFIDIMTPYRDIVKNFLLLIAVIIGLFDFFKRS